MNKKRYARFWMALILASVIIHLLGCTLSHEITYTEVKTTGGLFVEEDTIINNDTLYFWK